MNRKIIKILFLCFYISATYALNKFQDFDNQASINFIYSNTKLSNLTNSNTTQSYNNTLLGLTIEKLFDNNLWLNINGNFTIANNLSNGANLAFLNNTQTIGLPSSLLFNVGYGFNIIDNYLQIIPFLNIGKVLNYNGVTLPGGINNSYYYQYGLGGKLEYRINSNFLLYYEQEFAYLDDKSSTDLDLSAINSSSKVGVKINIPANLQLGLGTFYNYYQILDSSINFDNTTFTNRNLLQSQLGVNLYIGYNYNNHFNDISAFEKLNNFAFLELDNNMLIGLAFGQSNSSNSVNNNTINSTISFIDLGVNHLFENGILLDLEAQLFNNIYQSSNNNSFSPSKSNFYTPTYIGYPGNVNVNIGYLFPVISNVLAIAPYFNGGVLMNVNSYTIVNSQNLTYQLSHDFYYQLAFGGKLEYIFAREWQFYINQLFGILKDNSGFSLDLYKSASVIGIKWNIVSNLLLDMSFFDNFLLPQNNNSEYNKQLNQSFNLHQNDYGIEFALGLTY